MRYLVTSLLVFSALPVLAEPQSPAAPELFSPTLMEGWQVQPRAPTVDEQVQLAWRWAQEPSGLFRRPDPLPPTISSKRSVPSTVGQGAN
jgi:hypothetical protein